ncbi:hypothetical protein X777_13160 [Ooceraea biroi]|uniref:Secreted protein n=1 Tax=Ooceraea biroi TaxID=2015173 RepID=A0A026VY69_OOCBI|nr:hypothetical protein X777_13160 [Ooceraea biroi]
MNAIVEGTLYSSIVLIALLLHLADTYPISDAINTRTVQYEHLRVISPPFVIIVNSSPLPDNCFSWSSILMVNDSFNDSCGCIK